MWATPKEFFKAYINKSRLIIFLEKIVLVVMLMVLLITFIAVIFVLHNCSKYEIVLNLEGIIFFTQQFEEIKELIASALAMIALFFVIERINLMFEANYTKAKEAWTEDFLKEIDKIRTMNPYMAVYFEQISDKIYKYLLKRNFIIYNKFMLAHFYRRFISNQVMEFEENSKKYLDDNNSNASNTINYSEEEIKTLIGFIFRLSHYYKNLNQDFINMYHHSNKKRYKSDKIQS